MTNSSNVIQPFANAWLGFLDQVNDIVDTAIAEDAKGNWGSDAWIRLIHNLIDAQIRAYGLLVQISLSGPAALKATAISVRPRPSAPIEVQPTTYPRTIHTSGFVRLGLPGVKLPAECIRFYPEYLKAGDTEFRVGLTDYNYIGANYTGTIDLYRADAAPGAKPDLPLSNITVGL
jgi:hypothetical protein